MYQETYQFPPSLQKCETHRLANRLYRGSLSSDQFCECCQKFIGQQKLDDSISQYTDQNVQAVQQFLIFQQEIFLWLILSCTLIISLLTAYVWQCKKVSQDCPYDWFMAATYMSISSSSNLIKNSLIYIIFVQVCIYLHTIGLYYTILKKKNGDTDKKYLKLGQYAIKVTRLPIDVEEYEIKELVSSQIQKLSFQQQVNTQSLSIQNVIKIFDGDEFRKCEEENLKNFKDAIKRNQQSSFQPMPINQAVAQDKKYCQTAFIIFKHRQSVKYFLKNPSICSQIISLFCYPYKQLAEQHKIRSEHVSIEKCLEPSDIIWENCEISMKSRILRKLFVDITSLLLLVGGFFMQLKFKFIVDNTQSSLYGSFVSIALGIVVSLFGQISYYSLILGTDFEKPHSQTEKHKILIFRLSLYGFLTYGFFPVAIQIFSDLSQFSLNQRLCKYIVSIITSNQLFNIFFLILFDHFNLVEAIKRFFFKKYISKRRFFVLTQTQANQLYEDPQLHFSYRYSYLISTVWIMFFYAPLIPLVFIISYLGLLFNFLFVRQLIVENKIKRPRILSSQLMESACVLLARGIFFIAFGVTSVFLSLLYVGSIESINTQILIEFVIINLLGIFSCFVNIEALIKTKGCIKKVTNCIKNLFQKSQAKEEIREDVLKDALERQKEKLRLICKEKKIDNAKKVLETKDMYLYNIKKRVAQNSNEDKFEIEEAESYKPFTDYLIEGWQQTEEHKEKLKNWQYFKEMDEKVLEESLIKQYIEQKHDSFQHAQSHYLDSKFISNIYFKFSNTELHSIK